MNKVNRICLNMIVRNEEKVIRRCLQSVIPVIDYWVICDTGSTDSTKEIITETLQLIPGELHQHEWENFGINRTKALKLAKGRGDYILFIDADMVLNSYGAFKSELCASAYLLRYTGPVDYWQTMLVDAQLDWEYLGPTHAYLYSPMNTRTEKLNAICLTHFADGGNQANRLSQDIDWLTTALAREPDQARYLFYLAQSYARAGKIDQALMYYQKRIEASGWEEECWYAMYQLAILLEESEAAPDIVQQAYLSAYEFRPTRAEPLFRLVKNLRLQEHYASALMYAERILNIPYPQDILFIEKSVYDYLIHFEYAICAHYAGQAEDAIQANDFVIGNPRTPYTVARQAMRNKRFSLQKFIRERSHSANETPRIAAVSFDLYHLGGSGISLHNLLTHFAGKNWAVWKANAFPEIQELQDFKARLFISQQWATGQAYETAQKLNIPLIAFIHGGGQYEHFAAENVKPDYFLFNTAYEYFKVKKQNPEVKGIVSHPIIVPPEKRNGMEGDYITLIGNSRIKGVDLFVKIAQQLPAEKFLLVGEAAVDMEYADNITRIEPTPHMDQVYAKTKLLLVPSINESYGRVIVEAAYYDIVSIVIDCRGIREASFFENAIYIPHRENIGTWVTQIKRALNSPEEFVGFTQEITEALDTDLELKYACLKMLDWAATAQ